MVKASKGFRTGTRNKLSTRYRNKFKSESAMKEFRTDQLVVIRQNGSAQKGMPHPRYLGATGKVVGKRGDSYIVKVIIGKKQKEIISAPQHLKPL
jgi:large subunit ribosomal protein L21e